MREYNGELSDGDPIMLVAEFNLPSPEERAAKRHPPSPDTRTQVSMQTKLQQLLDGEIDAKEVLTNDPVVASLAERIYGINVEKLD